MFENGDSVVLWEDGGQPVSWAVVSAPIGGMSRVGPVHTPPEHRECGHGSAVTAAASQRAMAAGARDVILFTDLAKPGVELRSPEDRLPPGVRLDGAGFPPATLDDVTPPRLLVIQPDEHDPIGPLGDWLTGAGAELDIREPGAIPGDTGGYQGMVVLGGHMGAYDDLDFPWLADVRRLLAEAATKGLPTLAICLGAQLLAVATGGRVGAGPDGPEVGPLLVAKRDVGWNDPLFADLPFMPDVMQFHSDVVERLPPNASLLAASTLYPNQAFRVGRAGYGLQFHIETTAELVESWAAGNPGAAEFARPGDLAHERLVQAHADLEETWRPFAAQFVRLVTGELAVAGTPLPLIQH